MKQTQKQDRVDGMKKDTPQKKPVGRPTDYSPEVAESICVWLAGGKSLRSFCRKRNTPDLSTITRWIIKHDEFRKQYAEAREAAGYAHGDEVKEVVEMLRGGLIDPTTAKAMMDGLKWSAERMASKAYGPKQDVNHTSSDGSMTPPKTVVLRGVKPDDES